MTKGPNKFKYIKYIFLALLAVVSLLLVWGVLIEPRLIDEEHQTAEIPNLPQNWEGKRVALIADFQIGMWLNNTDTVHRIVDRLVAEPPAAVLIAGDFIYKPTEEEERAEVKDEHDAEEQAEARAEIAKAVSIVRRLTAAGTPVFAVLGNHDYAMATAKDIKLEWLGAELKKELTAAGVRVLENEAVPMSVAGDSTPDGMLYLVGVGSKYAGHSRPSAALEQLSPNAPRIALMHNPESFAEFPPNTAPLALAAHTHGGQIRLPLLPTWSWMEIVANGEIHADGWIPDYGQTGNRLYVNRGIGFSKLPVRINCLPEITFFTLYRSKPLLLQRVHPLGDVPRFD